MARHVSNCLSGQWLLNTSHHRHHSPLRPTPLCPGAQFSTIRDAATASYCSRAFLTPATSWPTKLACSQRHICKRVHLRSDATTTPDANRMGCRPRGSTLGALPRWWRLLWVAVSALAEPNGRGNGKELLASGRSDRSAATVVAAHITTYTL